ncbi:MAG: hypothetical protein IJH65_15460 [Methanobrevibacter sp.]|nr:hypothetical protein [Methanobrevibacter sp.]
MSFEDQLPKLISLKNLLNFFDIDLDLPPHLMELKFDECFKSSEVTIINGVYKLNFELPRRVDDRDSQTKKKI